LSSKSNERTPNTRMNTKANTLGLIASLNFTGAPVPVQGEVATDAGRVNGGMVATVGGRLGIETFGIGEDAG